MRIHDAVMKSAAFLTLLLCVCSFSAAHAEETPVSVMPLGLWKEQLTRDLLAEGISAQLVERAVERIDPDEDIIRLDRKQPEAQKPLPNICVRRSAMRA